MINETRRYLDRPIQSYGALSEESRLYDLRNDSSFNGQSHGTGYFVFDSISKWMVYHFHDTSANAPMRRSEIIDDYEKLRGDASNIAPFLYHLRKEETKNSTNFFIKRI